jgi:hypothetical protein
LRFFAVATTSWAHARNAYRKRRGVETHSDVYAARRFFCGTGTTVRPRADSGEADGD